MPRDAEICDVTVILKREYEDRMLEALEQLKKAGMDVRSVDEDNSVVEGSVESCNVHGVEHLPAVQYVRKVMTYCAEFPEGDPRDRNQGMGGSPDDLPPPDQRRLGKRYP
jgi:hypothetical protein